MKKSYLFAVIFLLLVCAQAVRGASGLSPVTIRHQCSVISSGELNAVKERLNVSDKPKAGGAVSLMPDLSKLNILKTKLTPAKNVEINMFSSLRDLFIVSITGILGLVGFKRFAGYYGMLKGKKRRKLKGLD